jgi:hypothetical protein
MILLDLIYQVLFINNISCFYINDYKEDILLHLQLVIILINLKSWIIKLLIMII